jgi:hypothetical protein
VTDDELDNTERRALQGLEREFDELRARHRDDPAFELLRAARAGVLPDPLQQSVTEHLDRSAWSRALVEEDAEAEPALDDDTARRLLSRITRSAQPPRASRWYMRSWLPALAAAAVLVVMVGMLRSGSSQISVERQPPHVEAPAPAAAAPALTLPFEKPDVKLTPQALVLRSDAGRGGFVDDIAPALEAYRGNRYVDAEQRFAALRAHYPASVEVAFYRAISQLSLDDAAGAVASLTAARRLDDGAFAPEIAWYLAVAHERAGDLVSARTELERLCRQTNVYAARACAAGPALKAR